MNFIKPEAIFIGHRFIKLVPVQMTDDSVAVATSSGVCPKGVSGGPITSNSKPFPFVPQWFMWRTEDAVIEFVHHLDSVFSVKLGSI